MEKIRELDPEKEDLQEVFAQWAAVFQHAAVTVIEAVKGATETGAPAFREALLAVAGIPGGGINNKRLGKYLAKNADKVVGGHVLRRVGKRGHAPLWRLDNAN